MNRYFGLIRLAVRIVVVGLLAFAGLATTNAQVATGGTYTLDQSVIANGGGTSLGTGYKVEGTSGQSAAGGSLANGVYNVKSGFWNPILSPTAAHVSVSGQVLTPDGRGLRNAVVILTGPNLTTPRRTLTTSFGYFTFDDIEAGQVYIITVSSRRYGFAQPTQAIAVFDNIAGLIFQAAWQN